MDCSHVDHIRDVKPSALGCEECLRDGTIWIQIRMCMDCGHVGCCDASRHKHAKAHFRATSHPIVRSVEPGEHWGWCYADRLWFEQLPPPQAGRASP